MTTQTALSFTAHLQAPFHDVDSLQIVWHGHYLKYFDIARFGLFEAAGIDLQDYYIKHNCLFPVIKTHTKHIAPLKHRDQFTCTASVREARVKIVLDFVIQRTTDHMICARGRGEQVAVQAPAMDMLLKIPDPVRIALEGC